MPPVRDGVLAPSVLPYKNTRPYQPGKNTVVGSFAFNFAATLDNGVAGTANLGYNLFNRGTDFARNNFGVPVGGPAIESLTDSMNKTFNKVGEVLKIK